ncbi:MAG: helix-turn-helix domain-containing protein [Roseovarius sp.]|nr:helix-turn-helix domain-containing protein [Roseovarius sp.]
MSHEATAWAFRQKGLRPATKIVLLYLADHHNPEFGCFPSQGRLAQECEMSDRAIRDHLAILESLKLITRRKREKVGTKFASDWYDLHLDRQVSEAGKPAEESSARKILPEEERDNSRRKNLPPNPVRGISKRARASDGTKPSTVPPRPAPHKRICIPRGSLEETQWNDWLRKQGYSFTLCEIGEPLGDGYDALWRSPPSEHNTIETMIAIRWADRLIALHQQSETSAA